MKLRIVIASLMFGVATLAAETGAELFQRGVTQERAAGNLEEAIKLYQRVVKEFASDRALAAKALVQEARCYEKLGQDKAVKVYEQVARDYRDQREPSATASARLAALRQPDRPAAPATMTQRKIEVPIPDNFSRTDGQRELYQDHATGALMISDLAGRDKRVIFKPNAGDKVNRYLTSRDLSMVFFGLFKADGSSKYAVIKADGSGYRELDGISPSPRCFADWSWDNRYLFACQSQPDGTLELLRISAEDGEIRKVRATDNVIHRPSPDGRFIAFAKSPQSFSKVFIASIQDGEPQLVSDNSRIVDWTRDGRYLAITSERSGSEALYLLPVKEGRLAGEPVFVRYGPCAWGSTNAAGALIYQSAAPGGVYATWLGMLDSAGHLVDWKQLKLSGGGNSLAANWSPDSAQIAYSAPDEAAGRNMWFVQLRNSATGEERQIYRSSGKPTCVWAAKQPNLFCEQFTQEGTAEVITLAIDSGRVERLGSLARGQSLDLLFASSDDRALYFWREPQSELIRWEISSQQATTVFRVPLSGTWGVPMPDERWIARRGKATIEIRPTSGGDWKPLISLGSTQMRFTPDGKWLLYHDVDAAGKHSLFRVATAGGQPERVGDFPGASKNGYLNISPDGQKVIAAISSGGSGAHEVWLLENFEPKQQAAR